MDAYPTRAVDVVVIDQSLARGSSRSNLATWTGILDAVRKLFATTSENQKFVSIELYQGESTDLKGNRKLGQVVLDDLPPGPPGSVRVELVMTVGHYHLVSMALNTLGVQREEGVVGLPDS